jgi:uncharacterized protein
MTAQVHVEEDTANTPVLPPMQDVHDAVDRAARRMAPLWSLRNFVAVNPYLGLADHPFEDAAHILAQRGGTRLTAPRPFYAEAIRAGRITDEDLKAALATDHDFTPSTVDALKAFAFDETTPPRFQTLPTVANVAGKKWLNLMVESISRWASAYFDQGQVYWKNPWSKLSPYAAWRAEAAHDRTPELRGLRDFRKIIHQLPASAEETIEAALDILDIPQEGMDAYFHRLFLTINGWASYARFKLWDAELYDTPDHTMTNLLAIRLAWEVALYKAVQAVPKKWDTEKSLLASEELDSDLRTLLAGELALQRAFDHAFQRELISKLGPGAAQSAAQQAPARKQVQAAFCIDVRSEVFRRAFESTGEGVETIGFAGFFGFPIEYVRLGEASGGAQCPALLTPSFMITESLDGTSQAELEAVQEKRWLEQRMAKIWRTFKFGAVSCFGFVGPVGLAYLKNLIEDTLGMGRPVPHPTAYGLSQENIKRLAPSLDPMKFEGRQVGMTPDQRLDVATGALKAMSLTDNFARVVLLVGHGSTTVNNPYASGLDCGACGGHTGEANARVAVEVINDPAVRTGLKARGITLPNDTIFVAAQHDTTTDTVTIFNKAAIPASHMADIADIEAQLAQAGKLARAERAPLLNVNGPVEREVLARSKDWSQVRPEWGLAGCAAFIVAPRQRTTTVDLNGRSFLHSYNWQQDSDFGVLELIMTAPMVVASWINLQYYASTVDNEFFGSGNKVLHNVVGTLGVLEGNGGDLRVGLPWQSVHDGDKYIHEPLRLNVIIEAPLDAMTDIIAKHEAVRQLVDNGWIHLFAMDETGQVAHRYAGNLDRKSVV